MAKPHLPDSVIRERLAFARSVDWNFDICANRWKITRGGVICFLNKQKEYRNRNLPEPEPQNEDGKPVYLNQRLFDIQVLIKEEWCAKWDIPLWEYNKYLKKYERECGEELATPERRAEWQRELDEKELRELYECKMPCRECLDKARWEAYKAGWLDAEHKEKKMARKTENEKFLDNEFEKFYDSEINDDIIVLNQNIIIFGKQLQKRDCEIFWTIFKREMERAFKAGAVASEKKK